MINFEDFYQKINGNITSKTEFVINGISKFPKGMVLLVTKNMPKNPYIKIVFNDQSFLLVMIKDKEIYYADKIIGHIKEIADEKIGSETRLEYNGKTYELGNKDDYQYVMRRSIGGPKDVEGEAKFSDYFSTNGLKEFLSLGWLSETGERADINCKIIEPTEINIL